MFLGPDIPDKPIEPPGHHDDSRSPVPPSRLPQIIGICMLAWAIIPTNPYGYYTLLRVVICGIGAYLAFRAYKTEKIGWVWVMGITAVVYNPIIRIYLSRELWSFVNILTILILGVTIYTLGDSTTNTGGSNE